MPHLAHDWLIPDSPSAVSAARDHVTGALQEVGDDCHLGPIVLVTSELVTNALMHGRPPRNLRLSVDPVRIRIEVSDGGDAFGFPHDGLPSAKGGWGLRIIEQAADRAGCRGAGVGKTIWAEFDR